MLKIIQLKCAFPLVLCDTRQGLGAHNWTRRGGYQGDGGPEASVFKSPPYSIYVYIYMYMPQEIYQGNISRKCGPEANGLKSPQYSYLV